MGNINLTKAVVGLTQSEQACLFSVNVINLILFCNSFLGICFMVNIVGTNTKESTATVERVCVEHCTEPQGNEEGEEERKEKNVH
jgi:hypothetical protein